MDCHPSIAVRHPAFEHRAWDNKSQSTLTPTSTFDGNSHLDPSKAQLRCGSLRGLAHPLQQAEGASVQGSNDSAQQLARFLGQWVTLHPPDPCHALSAPQSSRNHLIGHATRAHMAACGVAQPVLCEANGGTLERMPDRTGGAGRERSKPPRDSPAPDHPCAVPTPSSSHRSAPKSPSKAISCHDHTCAVPTP